MPLVDLVMPKMGESIMEATILKWLKQPGDSVKQDETVLEIATDKVDTEVPSVAAGTLEEILFQVNDVVPIGSVIARHPHRRRCRQRPVPSGRSGRLLQQHRTKQPSPNKQPVRTAPARTIPVPHRGHVGPKPKRQPPPCF